MRSKSFVDFRHSRHNCSGNTVKY